MWLNIITERNSRRMERWFNTVILTVVKVPRNWYRRARVENEYCNLGSDPNYGCPSDS